jgi:mono/diheme cytochrome c family protein
MNVQMNPKGPLLRVLLAASALVLCLAAADGSWLKHVPDSYRRRQNPYAGRADAVAGGSRLFADHCAKCHGPDALGRDERPSLRSARVQTAADGEIFWLLKNGSLTNGMPSWSALPEPMRWQLIAYVKSLGPSDASTPSKDQAQ